jgi:hypothetical protein
MVVSQSNSRLYFGLCTGVVGVVEKTAIAYIYDKLSSGKKFDAIESNYELIQFNKQLIKLSHKAT